MPCYRDLWLTATGAMAAVGIGTALVVWPTSGVVIGFAVIAVGTAALTLAAGPGDHPPLGRRRLFTSAVTVGACVIAATGITTLLDAAVVPVLALVAITSPPAVRWMRVLANRASPPDSANDCGAPELTDHTGEEPPTYESGNATAGKAALLPGPAMLDDAELCWAWRVSFVALQRSTSVPGRLSIVCKRQIYLDELERRNPHGLSAWFAAGARAPGDPSRYIIPAHRPRRPRR